MGLKITKLGGQLMKLFKNIIRLLALTSLSLSFTPLTTTKAATLQATNDTNITYASNNAVATSADITPTSADSDTTTVASGSPATSTVTVNVLSGILTLNAVPDFNFGTMMQGATAKLKNNDVDTPLPENDPNKTYGKDGNDSGLLKIIDSRNQSSKMPGFTLSASIGNLQNIDATEKLPAILRLSAMPLLDGDDNNITATSSDQKTLPATIDSRDQGTLVPVISLSSGDYNAGIISAKFNTPDSASLEIPSKGDNSKESSKNMNAIITWTLNAAPVVTN